MKERPILMSAPMVRALLQKQKTQTRRVMKSQPYTLEAEGFGYATKAGGFVSLVSEHCLNECPYGKPGNRLWVKETFHWSLKLDAIYKTCIDPGLEQLIDFYRIKQCKKWVPSIFMPRWASRITLEITEVRVQRLQKISWEDCIAEGIVGTDASAVITQRMSTSEQEGLLGAGWSEYLRAAYRSLWEQLNGAGSWDANPWVWAISFNVLGGAA